MNIGQFELLADKVAESFRVDVVCDGYKTFREMKRSQRWTEADIRYEICQRVCDNGASPLPLRRGGAHG